MKPSRLSPDVPPLWEAALCDGTVGVTDEAANRRARLLATREGICAGYSAGANVAAALQVAAGLPEGAVVVTVCPDTGLRYLSGDLFG